MRLTILIAAAGIPGMLTPEEHADQVATGALWAHPGAVVLRASATHLDARLDHADLLLTAGTSVWVADAARRATSRGVAVISLGGALAAAGHERHAVGIATFEPDGHPWAIDTGLLRGRLRQAAASAVGMTMACGAAAAA